MARRTPLEPAPELSQALGVALFLKREDLQDVFSFKIRGAANRIASLVKTGSVPGVVAASAGNHAQGIAVAAGHYGIPATIFMPVTTPPIKCRAVERRGADMRLIGDSYEAACDAARAFASETGAVFVHPFDEDAVIAGQGTIAREILHDMPDPPGSVYIGVGGGGLLSGIGAYLKTHAPATRIVAVEPAGAATLKTSLEAGKPTQLESVDGFADGVAVKMIGERTFDIIRDIAPDCLLVSNGEICAAVRDIFEQTRTVVEPAGALALAGVVRDIRENAPPKSPCVVIVSGANVNFDRIGHMVEQAELGAGDEILFAVSLPEKPGSFLKFCEALGNNAVTEFNYRYADNKTAHVLVGIKIPSPETGQNIAATLEAQGMAVTDLTRNALAKEHLRHMVGGRTSNRTPERIYSFGFPERPGALREFLTTLDGRWNISLFHYRNHGASFGNVLCGFQLPEGDETALEDSLAKTGFAMQSETGNPAYEYFLKA